MVPESLLMVGPMGGRDSVAPTGKPLGGSQISRSGSGHRSYQEGFRWLHAGGTTTESYPVVGTFHVP
jgi:hypothetical protein